MRLIINIDSNTYKIIKDENMSGNPWEISHAIANGTPIPDNATNGEVIKAIFPYIKVEEHDGSNTIIWTLDDLNHHQFDRDWWNAPYQKGGKE